MRQRPPVVDATGRRPSHPQLGREVLPCAKAADLLGTTTTTARALIEADEIDGFWERRGDRFIYFAYRDAVEAFLAQYGRFPAAAVSRRHARKTGRGVLGVDPGAPLSLSERLDNLAVGQEAILDEVRVQREMLNRADRHAAEQASKVLALEEAVRRLVTVNELLRGAVDDQEEAAEHLRAADAARGRALSKIAQAGDEQTAITALRGVPDLPPSFPVDTP